MPINGHQHSSKQRKTYKPTFVSSPDQRCEDCEYAGRLTSEGLSRPRHKTPLRPVSGKLSFDPRSTFGCETCKGTGRVAAQRARSGCTSNDPMEIPH